MSLRFHRGWLRKFAAILSITVLSGLPTQANQGNGKGGGGGKGSPGKAAPQAAGGRMGQASPPAANRPSNPGPGAGQARPSAPRPNTPRPAAQSRPNPVQARPAQGNPAQLNPGRSNPAQANPTRPNPLQQNPSLQNPSQQNSGQPNRPNLGTNNPAAPDRGGLNTPGRPNVPPVTRPDAAAQNRGNGATPNLGLDGQRNRPATGTPDRAPGADRNVGDANNNRGMFNGDAVQSRLPGAERNGSDVQRSQRPALPTGQNPAAGRSGDAAPQANRVGDFLDLNRPLTPGDRDAARPTAGDRPESRDRGNASPDATRDSADKGLRDARMIDDLRNNPQPGNPRPDATNDDARGVNDRDVSDRGDNNRPDRGDSDRPALGDTNRPDRGDNVRPDRGDNDRPGRNDSDRPDRGDMNRPDRGDTDRPDRGDNDRPGRGDNDRPDRGDNDRPDRNDPSWRDGRPGDDQARIDVERFHRGHSHVNQRPHWANNHHQHLTNVNRQLLNRSNQLNAYGYNSNRINYWNNWGNPIRGFWLNNVLGNNYFTPSWFNNHPYNWGAYSYGNAYNSRPWSYWWNAPQYNQFSTWFSWGPNVTWNQPIYYDYGPGGNVYYQDNMVYVNSQPLTSADAYAQSAAALATVEAPADPVATQEEDWMPLGTFALVANRNQVEPQQLVQLAVNRDGVVSGTMFNKETDEATAIQGRVDKETQRVAFRVDNNDEVVYEAGLYNLTQPEAPVLVHFGTDRSEQQVLVRLEAPETDDANLDRDQPLPSPAAGQQ